MKRITLLLVLILVSVMAVSAAEPDFESLSEAQRFDLAHAYDLVADKFAEMGETERSDGYRQMTQVIYPGYGKASERPVETTEPTSPVRPEREAPDPAGESASRYFFSKLLKGVFNENIPMVTSVVAETLFLPLFDQGVDKVTIESELEWFFSEYDLENSGLYPEDVFVLDDIETIPLDNGYWRLDVRTQPGYEDAVPEVTFWSAKMGFYFRKFPEGWRLAAIGPVA